MLLVCMVCKCGWGLHQWVSQAMPSTAATIHAMSTRTSGWACLMPKMMLILSLG